MLALIPYISSKRHDIEPVPFCDSGSEASGASRQRVIGVHAGFHTPGIALKSPEGRNRIGRIVPRDTSFAQSPRDVAGETPIPRDTGS